MLPPQFTRNVIGVHGEAGRAWLADLPRITAECASRWGLSLGTPYELSYHMVQRATLPDGRQAVLKLIPPFDETFTREAATLAAWGGRGAVELIAHIPELGAMLLERATPGTLLTGLYPAHDEQATRIAAHVMRQLWVTPPPDYPAWTAERRLAALDEAVGTLPTDLLDHARTQRDTLLATAAAPVVLHGDLHHYNILRKGAGWVAIDPHGLTGEPCYEVGALLRNPLVTAKRLSALAEGRIAVLAAELGFSPQRMWRWAFVQSVLSAWWFYDDNSPDDAHRMERFARAILSVNPH